MGCFFQFSSIDTDGTDMLANIFRFQIPTATHSHYHIPAERIMIILTVLIVSLSSNEVCLFSQFEMLIDISFVDLKMRIFFYEIFNKKTQARNGNGNVNEIDGTFFGKE